MKIVILSDDFPPRHTGGASVVASDMAKNLSSAGHAVTVITTVRDKSESGDAIADGVRVVRLFSKYPKIFRAYVSLWNIPLVRSIDSLLKEICPDVVHAHNIHHHLSYASLGVSRRYTQKVFLTVHDAMPFHYGKLFPKNTNVPTAIENYRVSPWQQWKDFGLEYNPIRNSYIRRCLNGVTKVFAVSNALAGALAVNGIKNVSVMHNGISLSEWVVSSESVDVYKKDNGINESHFVLFFGGRISRAKGSYAIIDALRLLPESIRSGIILCVAGAVDDGYRELMAYAEKYGLGGQIRSLGWLDRDAIKTAYAMSRAVLVPSLCYDWFPTNNLEAMAMKKPVIASCFGGSGELVENEVTGYIVNPYDTKELTEKITILVGDPVRTVSMGEAGYERVKNLFTDKIQTEKLLAEYAKGLSQSGITFDDTTFYDKESAQYSARRYTTSPKSYTHFFFSRRLLLIIKECKKIFGKINYGSLDVLEVGCADGVVLQKIVSVFSMKVGQAIGVDISPQMIVQARTMNADTRVRFFIKQDTPQDIFSVVLAVGFLSPSIFETEFSFIKKHLRSDGIVFCTVPAKTSLFARFKLGDKVYAKDYQTYKAYEAFFRKDFEILASVPYGFFVPKLWALPSGIANLLQIVFEKTFSFFGTAYHEKLYVLRKKS